MCRDSRDGEDCRGQAQPTLPRRCWSVGLASYGLLHLVIAWIALQLVFGKRGEASQQGALSQLARAAARGACCGSWLSAFSHSPHGRRLRPPLVAIRVAEMAGSVVD